jgi:hypothetical protein
MIAPFILKAHGANAAHKDAIRNLPDAVPHNSHRFLLVFISESGPGFPLIVGIVGYISGNVIDAVVNAAGKMIYDRVIYNLRTGPKSCF